LTLLIEETRKYIAQIYTAKGRTVFSPVRTSYTASGLKNVGDEVQRYKNKKKDD